MSAAGNQHFDRVRAIIAEVCGVDRETVTIDTDLARDLGIAGDDAADLFAALDREFDIDWTGLRLPVHFGEEGCGLPKPWQLKDSDWLYGTQPCTVSDIVNAAATGKWRATPLVPHARPKRAMLYLGSYLQFGLFALIVTGIAVWAWTRVLS